MIIPKCAAGLRTSAPLLSERVCAASCCVFGFMVSCRKVIRSCLDSPFPFCLHTSDVFSCFDLYFRALFVHMLFSRVPLGPVRSFSWMPLLLWLCGFEVGARFVSVFPHHGVCLINVCGFCVFGRHVNSRGARFSKMWQVFGLEHRL